jgi:hypothetical protein
MSTASLSGAPPAPPRVPTYDDLRVPLLATVLVLLLAAALEATVARRAARGRARPAPSRAPRTRAPAAARVAWRPLAR